MLKEYIILGSLVLGLMSAANARPVRVTQLPNGNVNGCANCHNSVNGGGSLNPFGTTVSKSFLSGGNVVWGAELAAIDSDGDGQSNGAELQDPTGSWKSGSIGDPSKVTNPGNKLSVTDVIENMIASSYIKINNISPNPATINSRINFSVMQDGKLNISLFGINGNLVSTMSNQFYGTGNYSLSLADNNSNIANVTEGVYFIKISNGNISVFEKIIISK